MRARLLAGFSLMEMMVVLLIIAIIVAASAPMVSKKISRGTSGEGPWAFTGMGNSIFYSASNNSTAMIGALRVPDGSNPKLYVQSAGNEAQIGFGRSGSNSVISLIMDTVNSRAGFSNASIQNNSVAMGTNQTLSGNSFVAIGDGVQATTNSTTAIGQGAQATGTASTALGAAALATNNESIAIGGSLAAGTEASGSQSIAIGEGAKATGMGSIAIGYCANSLHRNSVAIGSGLQTGVSAPAVTTADNQIVLGSSLETVYIPGNLVVRGDVALGSSEHKVYISTSGRGSGDFFHFSAQTDNNKVKTDAWRASVEVGGASYSKISDRRLKNVGKKYTSGLDELKKLDFFNYTFKKDESKTPRVGVMAQDLQKVFPDAVVKGDDGYLRIRLEDMFYAVINAVKELDLRYSKMQKTIDEQQKTIDELVKRIEKLEQR